MSRTFFTGAKAAGATALALCGASLACATPALAGRATAKSVLAGSSSTPTVLSDLGATAKLADSLPKLAAGAECQAPPVPPPPPSPWSRSSIRTSPGC